jgi:hypothetical protein
VTLRFALLAGYRLNNSLDPDFVPGAEL